MEPMKKGMIIAVDDEEDILELLRYNLSKEGFSVLTVPSGEEALSLMRRKKPDLVLLDLMLAELDGLEVCREMKQEASPRSIPIIMLTAKGEESDIVAGLELGADDYVTKPFSPRELLARVRAIFRRIGARPETTDQALKIRELQLDPQRHAVHIGKMEIELTAGEFKILYLLAKHPGWVFPRSKIVDSVKGTDYPVTDRSVDVQVMGIRRKLAHCADYIQTVRGVGYRFVE